MDKVSVVIPTYNRNDTLARVLACLRRADCEGIEEVEVIVVDDGSPVPARPVVEALKFGPPFQFHCVRQENQGPAAARNTGFRETHNDLVIFIDDDVHPSPGLIKGHIRAHRVNPGAVIFGDYRPDARNTGVKRFLESLQPPVPASPEFQRVLIVASGHVSIERKMFQGFVYRSDLKTPAAEEYELSARLSAQKIPLFFAPGIKALHEIDGSLEKICQQQYRNGMGAAEAACKYPDCVELPPFRSILAVNGYLSNQQCSDRRWKLGLKRFVIRRRIRKLLLSVSQTVDRFVPFFELKAFFYRAAIGAHFLAGIQEGFDQFGGTPQFTSRRTNRMAG